MTPKRYLEGINSELDDDLKNSKKATSARTFIYDLAGVFTGVMGFFTLFTNPWLGIPLFATASMFLLGKNRINGIQKNTTKRLESEKRHIDSRLKNGIDMSRGAIANRKTGLLDTSANNNEAEGKYKRAQIGSYLVNGIIIGGTALAGTVGGPVFGLIPVVGALIKNRVDKNTVAKHDLYQVTSGEKNKFIYDNTVSDAIVRSRRSGSRRTTGTTSSNTNARTNTQARTNNTTRTNTATRTNNSARTNRQVRTSNNGTVRNMSNYSQDEIRAVDSYIESLGEQTQNERPVQKRKI